MRWIQDICSKNIHSLKSCNSGARPRNCRVFGRNGKLGLTGALRAIARKQITDKASRKWEFQSLSLAKLSNWNYASISTPCNETIRITVTSGINSLSPPILESHNGKWSRDDTQERLLAALCMSRMSKLRDRVKLVLSSAASAIGVVG